MFEILFPILILAVLTTVTVVAMLYLPELLARKTASSRKLSPYECGIVPVTDAQERFPVKFFLIAIDFVVFDVEVVFLYPWAVIYKDFALKGDALYGFSIMGVFLILLVLGFIYVVGKGGLRWE